MKRETDKGGLGLLAVRVASGSLLAAHGSQKLFGWFDGPGLKNWNSMNESMGMTPGAVWGPAGGMAEFGGGLLTALGFLNPIGPLGIISAMTVATRKVHWGKPVFVTKGGAELPLINIGIALAVALEGPGAYSLDNIFGIRLPAWMRLLAVSATAMGIIAALRPDLLPASVQGMLQNNSAPAAEPPSEPVTQS